MSDAPYSVPAAPGRRARRLALLAAVAVVAVAVAALGIDLGISFVNGLARQCGPGVLRQGTNECVGVTDGSYTFTRNLADVESLILAENNAISQQPHVSIAYLLPMTVTPTEATSPNLVRHELEGAYVAQVLANETSVYGDDPKIRLLLANTGSQGLQWRPVVDDVARRTSTGDHLVAVAGLGVSLDTTRAVLAGLHEHQIPMVGAVFTADDLGLLPDGTRMNDLVRVAPTNSDEAGAAIAYARGTGVKTALVVQDDNPRDLYSKTLGDEFASLATGAPTLVGRRVEHYRGDFRGVGTTFYQMQSEICDARPDMIYFAGRAPALQTFAVAMANRECPGLRINIVTGDTAADLAQTLSQPGPDRDLLRGALGNGVGITYTGLANPREWDAATGDAQVDAADFQRFLGRYQSSFHQEPLEDGEAMMGHDAVLTAITAVRKIAAAPGSAPAGSVVTTQDLVQEWNRLDTVTVPGASGRITFDENTPANRGNPIGKAIPILRLNADGTVAVVQVTKPAV